MLLLLCVFSWALSHFKLDLTNWARHFHSQGWKKSFPWALELRKRTEKEESFSYSVRFLLKVCSKVVKMSSNSEIRHTGAVCVRGKRLNLRFGRFLLNSCRSGLLTCRGSLPLFRSDQRTSSTAAAQMLLTVWQLFLGTGPGLLQSICPFKTAGAAGLNSPLSSRCVNRKKKIGEKC